MNLVTTGRRLPPSREMAARIRELAKGGEELFERANLRPSDERWWLDTTAYIADCISDECFVREATEAQLLSRIPESVYRGCYDQRDKDKVTRDHLATIRKGGAWLLSLGYLIRDTERILMEGIHMGDEVIHARSQLRAFAWVIASETGYAKVVDDLGRPTDEDHGSDEDPQDL